MNLKGKQTKRGFTLIELLAVIVILAIIALIATPIILNMINEARKSAAKSSTLGYVDSIEAYTGFRQLSEDADIDGYDVDLPSMTNGKVTCTKTSSGWETANNCKAFFEAVDKKNKGKAPDEAIIVIGEDGKVQDGTSMKYNGYNVTYDGKDATVGGKSSSSSNNNSGNNNNNNNNNNNSSTFKGTKVAPTSTDTHKGIVYMDPTDLSATCTSSTSVSTTGTKSGCMKFYIFDDSGSNYKMILDHNTTAKIAYETSGTYKEYAQASIKTTVDDLVTTNGWQVTPRLITANEIATITNTSTFDGSSSKWFYLNGTGEKKQTKASSSQGDNEYAWLFDYTNGCESSGCNTQDSSNNGYWTSSPVSGSSSSAWRVSGNGILDYDHVDYGDGFGVRPVITISKTQISS